MSIESIKLSLIEQLMHVREESILKQIEKLLKKERTKTYKEDLHPMTIEELEERLHQSENDIKTGKVYSSNQVREYFKSKKG